MFKTFTLAAAVVAATATFASANNDISNFVEKQDSASLVDLGTVTAAGAGVVEVYTYHGGELGALLGTQNVAAGANIGVKIGVANTGLDAIAVLKVGGEIVDTQEIEFN